MPHIGIIIGTTRPHRFGEQPARWVADIAKQKFGSKATFDLIDLRELNLPLFDEPASPSMAPVTDPAAQAWTKQVGTYDGFLIVTGEYNHSIPAVLKNAIDFVAKEWRYKPVAFISYGSPAGGSRAVEHLRAIAGETRLYDLRPQLLLSNYYERLDANGQYQFSDAERATAEKILDVLVYWAEAMKAPREAFDTQRDA